MPAPTADDTAAIIAKLPAELRPETPILSRDDMAALVPWIHPTLGGSGMLNAYDALRREYGRVASAYNDLHRAFIAITSTVPRDRPVPLRFGSCDTCGGHLLSAAESDRGRCPICEHYGLEDSPADADLSRAAASFRVVGSPFARPGVNIPAHVPVAIHRPDMTTGTLPGEEAMARAQAWSKHTPRPECPAAAAIEDIYDPAAEKVRAALADEWDDIDREPEETASCITATTIKADLANFRDQCNQL